MAHFVHRGSFRLEEISRMKFYIFTSILVVAFSANCLANDEYFKVKCIALAPNRIQVRLSKSSADAAVDIYSSSGEAAFKNHLKEKFKEMPTKDETCVFGAVGDYDWDTAAKTFVDGYQEFKFKTSSMSGSPYSFLYLNTERGLPYDSHGNMFNLGN